MDGELVAGVVATAFGVAGILKLMLPRAAIIGSYNSLGWMGPLDVVYSDPLLKGGLNLENTFIALFII